MIRSNILYNLKQEMTKKDPQALALALRQNLLKRKLQKDKRKIMSAQTGDNQKAI